MSDCLGNSRGFIIYTKGADIGFSCLGKCWICRVLSRGKYCRLTEGCN